VIKYTHLYNTITDAKYTTQTTCD